MLGVPRAASVWLSDPVLPGRRGWGKGQRLLRAPEFAALAGPGTSWRATRQWIALSVHLPDQVNADAASKSGPQPVVGQGPNRFSPDRVAGRANVRFGITVSKRQARRAVARNMVKRILRESARHAAGQLCTAVAGGRAEVLLRLKSPLPDDSAASWSTLKGQLRREADSLMEQLRERLRQRRQELAQSATGAGAPMAKSAGAQT